MLEEICMCLGNSEKTAVHLLIVSVEEGRVGTNSYVLCTAREECKGTIQTD